MEKFSAVTKQNLESIGDGRLSLRQKSLNVELAGLFNQGKRSNLVKKLASKQRMNKARCQGNLADLLQGPKIQTAENTKGQKNSEGNCGRRVLNFPKKQRNYFKVSALASKMG